MAAIINRHMAPSKKGIHTHMHGDRTQTNSLGAISAFRLLYGLMDHDLLEQRAFVKAL